LNELEFRNASNEYADSLAALPFDALQPAKLYLGDFTMPCPDSCYNQDSDDCENGLGRDCGIFYDCRNSDWVAEYTCMRNAVDATYRPELRAALTRGALIWNFQGHANKYFMAHEVVFRDDTFDAIQDVGTLKNEGMPFVFLGFACHLAEFDNADENVQEDCIAEKLMNVISPSVDAPAGAIGAFASSGFEFLGPNLEFNAFVFEAFFHPERVGEAAAGSEGAVYDWTLGESTTRSRLLYQDLYPPNPFFDRDRQAAQRFVLLGDPAVTPDSGTPQMSVTVNGAPAANGEYLDLPEVLAPIEIAATIQHGRGIGSLRVRDTVRGEVPAGELTIAVDDSTSDGVAREMSLRYTHSLRADTYDLVIEATNARGAATQFVLRLSSELKVLDVAPFPNPFSDELRLYYRLTRGADEVRARIFTVAGRKIYETKTAPANADVNMLVWDGRDESGNPVANGTYLLTLRAASPEGESEAISRIVKMR
jgi:hypothetical protein